MEARLPRTLARCPGPASPSARTSCATCATCATRAGASPPATGTTRASSRGDGSRRGRPPARRPSGNARGRRCSTTRPASREGTAPRGPQASGPARPARVVRRSSRPVARGPGRSPRLPKGRAPAGCPSPPGAPSVAAQHGRRSGRPGRGGGRLGARGPAPGRFRSPGHLSQTFSLPDRLGRAFGPGSFLCRRRPRCPVPRNLAHPVGRRSSRLRRQMSYFGPLMGRSA